MLGLRQEEQGERGPPTWAKGSVLGPSRVPGLQDPAAHCTLEKAASAVGCRPRSQQQRLTSPTSLQLCQAVRRVGRSLCSASGQEVRAEAGWGGQAPPLALLPPLQTGPGEHGGLGAGCLSWAGLCPQMASSRLCLGASSPETKARRSAWHLAPQAGTAVARGPSPMGAERLPGASSQLMKEARPRKQGSADLCRR